MDIPLKQEIGYYYYLLARYSYNKNNLLLVRWNAHYGAQRFELGVV